MGTSTDYLTLANFCSYANMTTASHPTEAAAAITAASRAIDGWCSRSFSVASSTSSRVYKADHQHRLEIDDLSATTGLTVITDEGDTGTYGTSWTITTDFVLEPFNGRVGGITGWPYTQIRAVGARWFPSGYQRPRVQVTSAYWGWAAVPDAVTQACYELALDLFKMKDAPFGVAGFNEYGVMRVRENKGVQMLLAPYRRHAVLI